MTKIRVESFEIETRDIVKITESGFRRIGFKIYLVGGKVITIDRGEPYDMTPMGVRDISKPYERMRQKIEEKWKADKSKIETFVLGDVCD